MPSATQIARLQALAEALSPYITGTGLTARRNSGANVGTRPRFNFIEGTNITLTITDDAGDDEVDITIDSSGGGSGLSHPQVMARASLGI